MRFQDDLGNSIKVEAGCSRAGRKAQYNTGWHRSVAELKPVLKVTKTRGTQLIKWPPGNSLKVEAWCRKQCGSISAQIGGGAELKSEK